MVSERIQRQIDRLLDQAEEAITNGAWPTVDSRARSVLAIDPANPMTPYSGTRGAGVFQSTDGGANWSAANSGLPDTTVRALAIDPTNPMRLYAGTLGDGVFKTTDGGANWSAANDGLNHTYVLTLAIDPTNPMTLYAGTRCGGVVRSKVRRAGRGGSNRGSTNH